MAKTSMFRDFTPMLLIVGIIGSLGALSFGYDNGWWGLILGAGHFNQAYGTLEVVAKDGTVSTKLSSVQQSSGTALGTAGIMIGLMITPTLNERYGRKKMFMLIASIGIVGATIQATSTVGPRFWVLVVGKIVLNISVGIASGCVGNYLSECAPASLRGFMMSFYSIIQNVGYVLAGATVYGVIDRTDDLNWLLPICIQFVVPVIMLIATPFLVESPRWLVSKGKMDEATRALKILRGKKGAKEDTDVHMEVEEIRNAYEDMRRLHSGVGWLELFRGANRRRTMIAMGLQSLQQAQGVSFVANYLVILFLELGIQNVYLTILMIYVVLLVASTAGMWLPDRFGRRPLLLIGGAVQASCMLIVGIIVVVTAGAPTGALANLLVACFFIWVAVFSVSWSPMPWTISAEIGASALREKTLAVGAFAGFAVGLLTSFVVPYIQNPGYGNLGGKIAFLWCAFSVVSFVFAYFFVPEMRGRSLEELDYMFEERIGARQFSSFDTSALMDQTRKQHDSSEPLPMSVNEDDKKDLAVEELHIESVSKSGAQ